MHMNRFVVFQVGDEWLVTYGDRKQNSFTTREEAEHSAFYAADSLASSGHAVSVLIMPNLQGPDPQRSADLSEHTLQVRSKRHCI